VIVDLRPNRIIHHGHPQAQSVLQALFHPGRREFSGTAPAPEALPGMVA